MNVRTKAIYRTIIILFFSTFAQVGAQQHKRKRVTRTPSQPAPKVRFVTGKSALKIPFELSGNLILLQATVNESAPLWFILDTGADSTVIDTQLAKALRLKPRGRVIGTGSAGTAEALILKAIALRLPNVEALNQRIAAIPIDFLSAHFGRKISGVLGNDIIKEFVVEIDYASQIINLYEPASFRYSGSGEVIPITLEENLPFLGVRIVLERIDAIDGKFELDSGSTGAVAFNTPFVNKYKLLNLVSKTTQSRIGGVGGSAQSFSGRLKIVKLGGFELKNLVARFSRATRGDYSSARYDGLIGGEIFRRFKVIFDYSRRQMILEPNAQFSEPYEIDMSGLDIAAEGNDFSVVVINEVEKDSPAAQAGIEAKDVITAIDGRPTAGLALDQIRRLFMRDGGTCDLGLKRGKKVLETKLKLRRSI